MIRIMNSPFANGKDHAKSCGNWRLAPGSLALDKGAELVGLEDTLEAIIFEAHER